MLLAAVAFSIWGVLVYLRCLDYVLRRRLVAIATICALWMIEVILKYKSFTPFYATVLWYLYYVPMTLIPLLYQLCGLRLAGLEQHRLGRRYCAALWIVAILLIGFVLTNDFHQQVFHFDRTSDTGATITRTVGVISPSSCGRPLTLWPFYPGGPVLVLSHSTLRARRRSCCWAARSLPSHMRCVCPGHGGSTSRSSIASCVWWRWKSVSDCGVIPSYHDIAGIFRHSCRLTSKF
ncbi:MAG: histidine kinase N-terminal 7TM domain-containing protein [Collinsella aerofaciens]